MAIRPLNHRFNTGRNISRILAALTKSAGLFGLIIAFAIASVLSSVAVSPVAVAAAGTNQTVYYQGRLLTNTGAVVPDGNYSMEFKIYQDGTGTVAGNPGGTLKWTEDWVYATGSPDNRVTVRNGYFSVALGSICSFTSTTCTAGTGNSQTNTIIDWNQDTLWLSMAVGQNLGTNATFAASTPDPEMLPMRRMGSAVYALNSARLGGLTAANFVQLAQGIQTDSSTTQASIAVNKTNSSGSPDIMTLQKNGTPVFRIDNAGAVTATGPVSITGASALTLGTTGTSSGAILFKGSTGGSGTITLQAPANPTTGVITLPATVGNANDCLKNSGTAGNLTFGTCGAAGTLQNAYDAGNTILTTDARDINFTLANTATDANFLVNIATSSSSKFAVQSNSADVLSVNSSSIVLNVNTSLAGNQSLTIAGGAALPGSPTQGMIYYDTGNKELLVYSNGKWQADRSTATKIVAANNSPQAMKDAADYLATGTGDQATLNTALAAAAGGKVYLAEGTYTVSGAVNIPANTTLSGSGYGTLIQLSAISGSTTFYVLNPGNYATIQDIRLDGTRAIHTTTGQLTAIGGWLAGHVSVQHSWIVNFKDFGTYLNGDASGGENYNTITGNYFENNGNATSNSAAIYSTGSYDVISNNTFYNNYRGLFLTGSATQTRFSSITGNTIRASVGPAGIDVYQAASMTITGNTVEGSSQYGIYVNAGNNMTISGNTVSNSADAGIKLNGTNYSQLSGNMVENSGGATNNWGINIDTSADSNSITGNTITDSSCTVTCHAIMINNANDDFNYLADNRYSGPLGGVPATINDLGTNTRYANQLSSSQILQSGSSLIKANASSAISGTGITNATATLTGTGTTTYFLNELQIGDRITVAAETRTVTAIAANNSLTVDTAFTTSLAGQTITRLPAALVVKNSAGANQVVVNDIGAVNFSNSTDSANALKVQTAGGSPIAVFNVDTTNGVLTVRPSTNNAIAPFVVTNTSGTTTFELKPNYGTNNLFMGSGNATAVLTGNGNIGLGNDALKLVTSGSSNVAIGSAALTSLVDGYSNTAVGFNAAYLNSSGYNNMSIGYNALYQNAAGHDNTAIGTNSLRNTVGATSGNTGNFNVANGSNSLFCNSTGYSNIGLGRASGATNTTGFQNTIIGSEAAYGSPNTTGNCAGSTTTYQNTIALGFQSAYKLTTGNGNIVVGSGAGANLVSGGSNLLLGTTASTLVSGSNNILIGTGTDVSAAGDSNKLNIGNTIYGDTNIGSVLFKNTSNSANAFQVQNAAGTNILRIDSGSAPTNLISNGTFDVDASGWAIKGASVTQSRVTNPTHAGAGAYSVGTPAAANRGVAYAVTLSANTEYTMTFMVRAPAAGLLTDIVIGRQDQSGTDIDCSGTSASIPDSWTKLICSFKTGSTISSSSIYVKKTGTSAETFYVDSVELNAGTLDKSGNTAGVYLGYSTTNLGYTAAGLSTDTGSGNIISASKIFAASTATVSAINVHVSAVAGSSNNKYQVAIYTDNNGAPGTLIANSAEGTLTANSWNSLAISANLVAGRSYWLAYNSKVGTPTNDLNYDAGLGQSSWMSQTYNTWPTTYSQGGNGTAAYSMYATTTSNTGYALKVDDKVRIGGSTDDADLSVLGDVNFTSKIDTKSAFNVTNAAGWNMLNVDTAGSRVFVNGEDGSLPWSDAGLTVRSSGGNALNLVSAFGDGRPVFSVSNYGQTIIQPSQGNYADTFQVQNNAGTSLLNVDTLNSRLTVGSSATVTGTASSGLATGTSVTKTASSAAVTGVGTLFQSELQVGDKITISGETRTIIAISSNTALTVDSVFGSSATVTPVSSVTHIPTTLTLNGTMAASDMLFMRAASSQSGYPIRYQDSNGLDLFRMYSDGSIRISHEGTNSDSSIRVENTANDTLFNVNTNTSFITLNGTKDAAGNLLQDGSFEGGSTYTWTATEVVSGDGIYNETANARTGNRVMKIAGSAADIDIKSQQWFAVTPGDTVYFEGYVKAASGNGDAGIYLEFRDKDKTSGAAVSYVNAYTGTPGASYSLKSISTAVSATACGGNPCVYARPVMSKRANATAGTYYFDDMYFVSSTQRAPYTFKNTTNSTTAFQIQNAAGNSNLFVADTLNNKLGIGTNTLTNAFLTVTGTAPDIALGSALRVNSTMASTTNNQYGTYSSAYVNPAAASTRMYVGSTSYLYTDSANLSGVGATLNGLYGSVENGGTGTVNKASGLAVDIRSNSTGTITNALGVEVYSPQGTGSITNSYGLVVRNQSKATNNYGLFIEGATTNPIKVQNGSGVDIFNINQTGSTLVKTTTNATAAFQVQNAAGDSVISVDTSYVDAANLVTDPSFEASIPGAWTFKAANTTLTQVSTQALYGADSMQVATGATANSGAKYSYALAASTSYSISMYVKASGANFSTINIGRQDTNGTSANDNDCQTGIAITTTAWTRISCYFTTGGSVSSPNIYIKDTGTNHTFFVDGVTLVTGQTVGSYSNGGRLTLAGEISSPLVVKPSADNNGILQVYRSDGYQVLNLNTSSNINNSPRIMTINNNVNNATTLELGGTSGGSGLLLGAGITSGNGILMSNIANLQGGSAIEITGTNNAGSGSNAPATVALTGNVIDVTLNRYIGGASVGDSGSYLNINRSINVQNAMGWSNTGNLVNFISNCTKVGTGSCTDGSSILNIDQQFAGATGALIKLTNAGTGKYIDSSVISLSGTGQALFKNSADSTTAFQIQDASAQSLLSTNTLTRTGVVAGNMVKIGNSTGNDTDTTMLVVDSATATPTTNLSSMNGGIFLNNGKMSIIESGAVKEVCNKVDLGCNAGGGGTLNDAYTADPDGGDAVIQLTTADGGLMVNDASTPLTTAFAVRNSAGSAKLLGVSASAVTLQDSAGNDALVFDSTSSELRVYENVASPTRYLRMYYDTANNAAVYGASSGTTQIGSGTGTGGDISLTLTGAQTDKLNVNKAFTLTGAYSGTDFNFVRNLVGTTYAMSGNVLKIEDTSGFTGGSSATNLLYINQNNTGDTGNLIVAQTGGATTRFSVSTAGNVSATGNITASGSLALGSGQAVSGSGNLTVDAGSSSTLSLGNTNATAIVLGGGTSTTITQKIANSSATALSLQTAGGTSIMSADTTRSTLQIGSATTDTTQIDLQLDSFSTYTDSTVCNTAAQGSLYYNSSSASIRSCSNSVWNDIVTNKDLGLLMFGVVAESGSGAGDLQSITSAGVNGPCKVSFVTTTTVKIVQGCTAYSGGRKVIIPDNTVPTGSLTLTSGQFVHVCLTGTDGQPAFSATGTEAANQPTFSTTAPILCLADIKAGVSVISNIYDVRTFTNTTKTYATLNAATGFLGAIMTQSATAGVLQLGSGIAQAGATGVAVATAGSGASNNTLNMIVAIGGPQFVKATGTSAVNSFVQATATAGYSSTAAISATGYANLGVARRTIDTLCNATTNCQFSQFLYITPR